MLHTPFMIGVAAGFLSYAVTFGFMEQEFRRHRQYKKWKLNKVIERCSTVSGLFFGVATVAYNLL